MRTRDSGHGSGSISGRGENVRGREGRQKRKEDVWTGLAYSSGKRRLDFICLCLRRPVGIVREKIVGTRILSLACIVLHSMLVLPSGLDEWCVLERRFALVVAAWYGLYNSKLKRMNNLSSIV